MARSSRCGLTDDMPTAEEIAALSTPGRNGTIGRAITAAGQRLRQSGDLEFSAADERVKMEAPGLKFTAALDGHTGDFEVRPETARLVAEGEDGHQVVAEGKTALRAYHDGLTRANQKTIRDAKREATPGVRVPHPSKKARDRIL